MIAPARLAARTALLAVVLTAGQALGTSAPRCKAETPPSTEAPGLSVQLTADKDSYRPGSRVHLTATVAYAVAAGPRVEGARVDVTVYQGKRLLAQVHGGTDPNGTVALSFRLPKRLTTTALAGHAMARTPAVVGTECDSVVTVTGAVDVDPLADVKR